MTTDQKGAIAETAFAAAAVKLGLGVYRSVAEGERHDLIVAAAARSAEEQPTSPHQLGEGVRTGRYTAATT